MKTFLQWVADTDGKPVDLDGLFGPQCVDLVDDCFRNVRGHEAPRGNAIDFAREGFLRPLVWTVNGPRNAPATSAVVVWGHTPSLGINEYGHVALAVFATGMELLTLDQNWAGREHATLVRHSYIGVLGWWT